MIIKGFVVIEYDHNMLIRVDDVKNNQSKHTQRWLGGIH